MSSWAPSSIRTRSKWGSLKYKESSNINSGKLLPNSFFSMKTCPLRRRGMIFYFSMIHWPALTIELLRLLKPLFRLISDLLTLMAFSYCVHLRGRLCPIQSPWTIASLYIYVQQELSFQTDTSAHITYRQRGANSLQALFKKHFQEFVDHYEHRYSTRIWPLSTWSH